LVLHSHIHEPEEEEGGRVQAVGSLRVQLWNGARYGKTEMSHLHSSDRWNHGGE